MNNKKLKVCFAASSGGHYEQLLMLRPLMERYDSFILTEKTLYTTNLKNIRAYYLIQTNRKEIIWILKFLVNTVRSISVFYKERPDVIVCTGVLSMIPMCLLCKLFGKRLIYIESFAKVTSGTESGRFLYRFADQFYVQWESMLKIYPKAIFLGGIY